MDEEALRLFSQRQSCKDFDPKKKVSKKDITEITEVFRMTPSMLNLQAWKLFIIEDEEKKQILQKYSLNQHQVGTNSHLLIFARKNEIHTDYIEKITQDRQLIKTMSDFIGNMSKQEFVDWSFAQVAVALGNVIHFLAIKEIDCCPIGLLDREKYNQFLGLQEQGYSTVYALCIGYKHNNTTTIRNHRLPKEEILKFI